MLFVSIVLFTTFIPVTHSVRPTLKLTFIPEEKYYTIDHPVEIHCELLNPASQDDTSQLWHTDLKTGKRTSISRQLVSRPSNDAPDIFRRNNNKHVEFLKKNHIRIRHLQLEDSAQYECTCPDCEQPLEDDKKLLQVMKLNDPQWHIEPGWPIQENAKTTIKCTADDFYPYAGHKIIHNHHEMVGESKVVKPENNAFPHKFSWEAVVTPTADWHNTTLQCTVIEGKTERYAIKNFEVLFTPRFLKCDEKQYVNSTTEKATITCEYSGNPSPTLQWFHQSDGTAVKTGSGMTIETIDEHHGKYKSILTLEREKLTATPLTTTTTTTMTTTVKSVNGKSDTGIKPKVIADNYYQQLLNDGFVVKIIYNNEEKGNKKINIVTDAKEVRSKVVNSSPINTIQYFSTSIIFSSYLTILYMIQYY